MLVRQTAQTSTVLLDTMETHFFEITHDMSVSYADSRVAGKMLIAADV